MYYALGRDGAGASLHGELMANKALEAALAAYVDQLGPNAAGAWASAKAGPLMSRAHPRGAAETAARRRAVNHFRKVPHAQEG